MSFTKAVATGDECDGFLVVHGHAGEGFADVVGGLERIWISVRAFWIDINEAHLHGGERVLEDAAVGGAVCRVVRNEDAAVFLDAVGTLGVTFVAAEPSGFAAPVDVVVRLPSVGTAAREAEGGEAHRF